MAARARLSSTTKAKDRSLRQLLQEIHSRVGAAEGCDLLIFYLSTTAGEADAGAVRHRCGSVRVAEAVRSSRGQHPNRAASSEFSLSSSCPLQGSAERPEF